MKILSVLPKIRMGLIVLLLAQLACSFDSTSPQSGATSAPAGSGKYSNPDYSQSTQPPAGGTSERGTPDEARAMLQLAVDHYHAVGRDQALADFNNRVPPFFDRDLYVACIGSDHIEVANGGFPSVVGSSADSVLTNDGTPVGQASWAIASTTTVNSISYHWVNPANGQTEPKTLWFLKVDDNDVCGVGAYTP